MMIQLEKFVFACCFFKDLLLLEAVLGPQGLDLLELGI
jgi:hypothetical protein